MDEKQSRFQDRLYAAPQDEIKQFVFDEKVAAVFEEMIQRSVPGYQDVVRMIGVLADRYVKPGSICYDLGSSLGAVSLVMRDFLKGRDCRVVAVDNSEAMVAKCRAYLDAQDSSIPVDVLCEDIRQTKIENASFVAMNFTLQFIPQHEREALISKIYEGMLPGGILVISEKLLFEESQENDFQIDLHHTFKRLHGYSELEISQKRSALENVLVPETLKTHQARLKNAGFDHSYLWFQCFNFGSLLAFKS